MATCFECGKKIGFLANSIVWEGNRICEACDYKKGVERENLEEEKNDLIKKIIEQPSSHKKSITVAILLAFFFETFGMLYVNRFLASAPISFCIWVVVAVSSSGRPVIFFLWLLCKLLLCIWAYNRVKKINEG